MKLLVRGGEVYAADGEPRVADVLLEDGAIAAIGAGLALPPGAEVLDAAGAAVVPGLVDLHVHFGAFVAASVGRSPAELSAEYLGQRPEVRRALLGAGVTTIRSVGDLLHVILDLARRTGAGELAGPRVCCSGPTFTAPGGHPAGTLYRGSEFHVRHGTRLPADAGEARAMVQALASAGVDGVKAIYGGTGLPRLSAEILAAIGAAAHELGLWFAVHTGTLDEVRTAALAGADTVEHGVTSGEALDGDTLALLVERNVTYVPTLVVATRALVRTRPDAAARLAANLRAARDAGVRLGAGTDTQGPLMSFGASMVEELEAFVAAGLSAREALDAATRAAGRALRDPRTGVLAPGARADLVVVDGRPWRTIADLRRVRAVVQAGRVVVVTPS